MTRFCLCEAEGRGSLCSAVSARSVATWQSMVEHCGVCEVDCFTAFAMTGFCLCEAEGRGSLCSTVSARSVATWQSIRLL